MAAARITTKNDVPVLDWNVRIEIARQTPAVPQRNPEISHARSTTLFVCIPLARANQGLDAVARIALPSFVFTSIVRITNIDTRAMPIIASCAPDRTIPPQ